jgi:hypothetical protein
MSPSWRETRGAIGHLPSYPDVLHDVLGLGGTPEHAVGNAEQPGAGTKEFRDVVVVVCHPRILGRARGDPMNIRGAYGVCET